MFRSSCVSTRVDGSPGRTADRRRGIAALLAAVTAGASAGRDPRAARDRLEEELRRALHARAVLLRDGPAPLLPPAADVLSVDVPLWSSDARARLEAAFDEPRFLDDWTGQLLDAAAHVAALLVELERASGRVPAAARRPADGAAPLIGSSEAIKGVRQRIERVAGNDFTILIEGESCR